MNIVIINGSPRSNGATATILHMLEEHLLQKEDAIVDFIDIGNLELTPCQGCCSCYKTGHCYMKDDAERLSDKILTADGLIIGSPTYASNVSGQLKQFIDRGHFVIEQLLYDKYAISVVTGENYGSSETSKILTKLLQYSGAKLSGKVKYNLPFNQNPGSSYKLTKKIGCLADRIYIDIERQRKYLIQCIMHKVIFTVGIKPFVMRNGESYKGVLDRWKNIGIIQ